MNFNFAGIQQMMFQPGIQQVLGTDLTALAQGGQENGLFSQTLGQLLGNLDSLGQAGENDPTATGVNLKHLEFKALLPVLALGQPGTGLQNPLNLKSTDRNSLIEALQQLPGSRGSDLVEQFKKLAMTLDSEAGQEIQLQPGGEAILGQWLTQAGFDADAVSEFTTALAEKMEEKGALSFKEVADEMDDLLQEPETNDEEEVLIPASTQPYLVSMLQTLGLPQAQVDAMMSEAQRGGSGLSLDSLTEQIQQILNPHSVSQGASSGSQKGVSTSKTSSRFVDWTNIQARTEDVLAAVANKNFTVSGEDTALFNSLMSQLNLPGTTGEDQLVSLEDFAVTLNTWKDELAEQKMAASGTETATPRETTAGEGVQPAKVQALMEKLFQHLSVNQTATASATASASNSEWIQGAVRHRVEPGGADTLKNAADFVADLKGNKPGTPEGVMAALNTQADPEGADPGLAKQGLTVPTPDQLNRTTQAQAFHSLLNEKHQQGAKNLTEPRATVTEAVQGLAEPKAETPAQVTAPQERPQPRTLPNHVMQQVSRGLGRAVEQGESSLTLQLKPAALGRLIMKIDNLGTSMKVSVLTEHHTAKEMLTSHAGELKQVMASAGISLDQFEVDMSSDFKQSLADANPQFGSGGQNKKNNSQALGTVAGEPEVTTVTQTGKSTVDNGVHFVA